MTKLIATNVERVETGPLQINDDWAGLFVRGDDCLKYEFLLKRIYKIVKEIEDDDTGLNWSEEIELNDLIKLFSRVVFP